MRRAVKVLANFLGAAKELTGEYAELAEITEDEQNQIRMSLTSRPDRKQAVKFLAKKGANGARDRRADGVDLADNRKGFGCDKGSGGPTNVGGRTDKCRTSAIDDRQRRGGTASRESRRGNARQPARRQAGDQSERHAAAPLGALLVKTPPAAEKTLDDYGIDKMLGVVEGTIRNDAQSLRQTPKKTPMKTKRPKAPVRKVTHPAFLARKPRSWRPSARSGGDRGDQHSGGKISVQKI